MVQDLEKWKKKKKNMFDFTDSLDRLDFEGMKAKRMNSFVSNPLAKKSSL